MPLLKREMPPALSIASPLSTAEHVGQRDRTVGTCPFCFGDSRPFISSTDRNRRTTTRVFQYHQCRECGLVFMDPIPDDLLPFYEGGYQTIPGSLSELRELASVERYRLNPILKYRNAGKLLEIGPWTGIFSCNAKDAGFDVTALEMDQKCVDFLNQTLGIRALQTADPATTLDQMDEKFDVITLWHSLEHLREPWHVIEQSAAHLAPGGILVIAIPNIESYQFSLLRSAWKHLDAPRHLVFYPIRSLVKLCTDCGLSVLETTTADELSGALSLDSWYSLANTLMPVRYARGTLARLMQHAARRKESKPNAGAGLTAVFQGPVK
jgi:2-polyprenyl-3-methyl-5-hydroxy-6-metoxy-1,4-benzoquinol methylase